MASPAPLKILLVDDRPENLLALEAILEPLGHTLISAQSGEEALKHLLKEDFAVVLLDVHMPGMDGFELATLIRERERLQATPIIFLTALSTSEAQIAQGYALGAVDYMLKPLDPAALRAKVAAFVELYRVRAAAQQQLQAEHTALHRSLAAQAQAEQALHESEERFRLLVEGVEEYAIFMLDPQGVVVSWNSGAERMTGYSAEAILGAPVARFSTPEDCAADKPDEGLMVAWNTGVYHEEGWRVRADGARFLASVVVSARYDPSGALRGFVIVMRDVTARKQAKDEQERLYQVAQAAIREREALFSAASHELKTPLTAMLGATGLLQRRTAPGQPLSERDHRLIDTIHGQAERLQRMIDVVLDTAQLEHGELALQRAPVDLGTLVARVVSELRATVSNHHLIYTGPDHPVLVDGDAMRLEQVVHNLVSNAIKYSPEGGAIRIALMIDETLVKLAVQDPGIGIPKAAQHRLFQRFSRLRNSLSGQIRGLGVGLYMVKEIITLHGGSVGVESEEGQGSTFVVSLPLCAHGAQDPAH